MGGGGERIGRARGVVVGKKPYTSDGFWGRIRGIFVITRVCSYIK